MTLARRTDSENRSPSGYSTYMASDAWAQRKAEFYRRHPRRCAACGSNRDLHVHHKTYARFGAEHDADLVCLCGTCHSIVHQHHAAVGGSLAAATDAILDLLRRAGLDKRHRRRAHTRKPAETMRDRRGRTIEKPSWLVVLKAD